MFLHFNKGEILTRIIFILFIFSVNNAYASLGTYPATSVTLSANVNVIPNAAPSSGTVLTMSTSVNFTGIITIDSITGVVKVTNAAPAGTYIITINGGIGVIESFLLTVNNPVCSQGNFGTSSSNTVGSSPYYVAIGEFNSDSNQDILVANSGSGTVSVRLGIGTGGFTGTTNISVGFSPTSIVVGDFNRDGKQDFASANYGANTVSIRFGNGAGGFTGTTNVGTGVNPNYLAIGDFNKDGFQDLAVTNSSSSSVSILTGDGFGGFTNTSTITVGTTPRQLVVGDFNADGNADLAVVNGGSSSVSIKLGNGIGGFIDNGTISSLSLAWAIAAGDFNNDSFLDLVINSGSSLITRLGTGTGSFTTGSTLSLTSSPIAFAVGDFNADGKQDITASLQSSNLISIRFGNGLGGFTGSTNISSSKSYFVALCDLNRDGRQDFVSANNAATTSLIYLGVDNAEINVTGNSFTIPDGSSIPSSSNFTSMGTTVVGQTITKIFTLQNTGTGPMVVNSLASTGASATDFTISGISLPLTINNGSSSTFNLLFSPTSTGTKSATIHINNNDCNESDYDFVVEGFCTIPSIGSYLDSAVFNGANFIMNPSAAPVGAGTLKVAVNPFFKGIVTTNSTTGQIRITNAHPAGTFEFSVSSGALSESFTITVDTPVCSTVALANAADVTVGTYGFNIKVGDFNNDNIQDFATCDYNSNTVTVKKGVGNGTFLTYATLSATTPFAVAVGDINSDGFQDLVVSRISAGNIAIFLGTGNGFTSGITVTTGNNPKSIALADFNLDGKIDLAVTIYPTNNVLVRMGDGTGLFSGTTSIPVGTNPTGITLADFNGDGKLDFATANQDANSVSIRYGDGTGSFTGSLELGVNSNAQSIDAADMDNDSIPDIIVRTNGVYYFKGNGTGGFNPGVYYFLNVSGYYIEAVDLNGDGNQDVLSSEAYLLGNGAGSFTTSKLLNISSDSPQAIAVGDYNGDGRFDLAVTTAFANKVLIRLNQPQTIVVRGNGIVIPSGTTVTSVSNNTGFGSIAIGNSIQKSFIIKNPGGDSISIDNITFSGSSDFINSGMNFPYWLKGDDSVAIWITCAPSSTGLRTADVHILYSKCDITDHSFRLSATGSTPVIGSYANVTVTEGRDTVISSNPVLNSQNNLRAAVPPTFNGKIFIDQVTGAIRIVAAKPQGIYPITIYGAGNLSSTFTLTVIDPVCSGGAFNTTNTITTQGGTTTIEIGDFNNDGKTDVASLSSYDYQACKINFGDGNGNFTPGANIFFNGINGDFISADFNSDGNLDLALISEYDSLLRIELGDGLGNFSQYSQLKLGIRPVEILTADVNGDNIRDLIVSPKYYSDSVALLIGSGNGIFIFSNYYSSPGYPVSTVTSDFNNDGKVDLATVNVNYSVPGQPPNSSYTIYLNNGLGGFSNGIRVSFTDYANQLISNDINRDGFQDLVIWTDDQIVTFAGNGTGNFAVLDSFQVGYGLPSSGEMVSGDFNGDSLTDFALSFPSIYQTYVQILFGNGSGGSKGFITLNPGQYPRELIAADLNKDGIEDILVHLYANNVTQTVRLFMGSATRIQVFGNNNPVSDGSVTSSTTNQTNLGIVSILGPNPKTFTIVQQALDSVVLNGITFTGTNAANFSVSGISFPYVLKDSGSVNFNVVCAPTTTGTKTATVHLSHTGCTTLDYDFALTATASNVNVPDYSPMTVYEGKDTTINPTSSPLNVNPLVISAPPAFKGIVTINPSTGFVRVTNPYPSGVYAIAVAYQSLVKNIQLTVLPPKCIGGFTASTIISTGNTPSSVSILDFNSDGKQDVAISRNFEDPNNNTEIKFGNGSGGFPTSYNLLAGGAVSKMAVADFNRDGFQDIAMALVNQNKVRVSYGNGVGAATTTILLTVSGTPTDVAVSDFNKDGYQDIVTVNSSIDRLSILLGGPSNTFTSANDVWVSDDPRQVAIGDINNDGFVDLVVCNYGYSTITVMEGVGNGTFAQGNFFSTATNPFAVKLMDYNYDGWLDILVIGNNSSIIHGSTNDHGNFLIHPQFYTGAVISEMTIRDMDSDGKQDILVTHKTANYVTILSFMQNQNFTTTHINVANSSNRIEVGDFDRNNIPDFITASSTTNNVFVNFGNTSTIQTFGNNVLIPNGTPTTSIASNTDFGNINYGDSVLNSFSIFNSGFTNITIDSITISGTNGNTFHLNGVTTAFLCYAGSNAFFNIVNYSAQTGSMDATVKIYYSLCGGQFNYQFAVHANRLGGPALGNYSWLTVDLGSDTLNIPALPPIGISILKVSINDLRFTGIIAADSTTGVVKITNAGPPGSYSITVNGGSVSKTFQLDVLPVCTQAGLANGSNIGVTNPYGIAIGDFNEDGIQDFVTAEYNSSDIAVRPGDGSGGFSSGINLSSGTNTIAVVVGDFNNDGHQDIASAVFGSSLVSTRLGNGTGGFGSPGSISVGSGPNYLALGDFNNDGNIDMACSNQNSNTISIRLGNGTGTFSGSTEVSVGSSPRCVLVTDFNLDGKADIAAANFSSNTVSIRLGNGTGVFSGTTNVTVGSQPTFVVADDFNSDGWKDIAAANSASNTVSIRFGSFSGTFTGTTNISVGTKPFSLAIGDFNGDYYEDIVVVNQTSNNISLLNGASNGTFTSLPVITAGTDPHRVALGDFNNDGRQDMVITNNSSNNVVVRLGIESGIQVTSNGNSIPDNSISYVISNNTDFNIVSVGTATSKTFTIQNTGPFANSITGIFLTGDSTDLTVSGITFPVTINSGSIKTFNINFAPNSAGSRLAHVQIRQGNCQQFNFDFNIKATGICNIPVFNTCPSMQTVTASNGLCYAAVNYSFIVSGTPTTTLSYQFTGATTGSGSFSGTGSIFNSGLTHVLITATNICGSSTCSFDIQVIPNTNDNNACTIDACNSLNGTATHTLVNSDDGNSCTSDGCNSITGVFHIPLPEICGNQIDDNCNGLIDETCIKYLNMNLFIEGFYLGNGIMKATINSINFPLLCDTIIAELHNSVSPYSLQFSDSSIVNVYGNAVFNFPYTSFGNSYYIVLRHRNALETWSASPVLFNDTVVYYSFTDSLSQAYGNNLFDLGDGNFALWSGDISSGNINSYGYQDGFIQYRDYFYMEQALFVTLLGYTPADLNGDGVVESFDYMLMENSYYYLLTSMHP